MPYTNPDETQKCTFCGADLTKQNIVPQEHPGINKVLHLEHIVWGYITSDEYDIDANKYFWMLKEGFKHTEIHLSGDRNGPFLNNKETIKAIAKKRLWIEGSIEDFFRKQRNKHNWVYHIQELFEVCLYFTHRENHEVYFAIASIIVSEKSETFPPFEPLGNGHWDIPLKMNKFEVVEIDLDDKFGLVSMKGINFGLL
jgi:hypothetical protein